MVSLYINNSVLFHGDRQDRTAILLDFDYKKWDFLKGAYGYWLDKENMKPRGETQIYLRDKLECRQDKFNIIRRSEVRAVLKATTAPAILF
jgi:hypothetical protein